MAPDLLVRRARALDALGISRLNNTFADDGQMLARTPETVALGIDDYVVIQTLLASCSVVAPSRNTRRAWRRWRPSP